LPRGRVAASPGDEARVADLLAVELGQAIDGLGLKLGRGVGLAVPLLVFRKIAQPEVGREIDDLQVARQRLDDLLARRVRERAEDEVDARKVDVLIR
jgi:hypothetical protein